MSPGVLLLSQLVYVAVAVITLVQWVTRRGRERFDIAAMFASLAAASILGWFVDPELQTPRGLSIASSTLVMAHPLLMLRILWHFQPRQLVVEAAGWLTLLLSAVVLAANGPVLEPAWVGLLVALFVGGELYAAVSLLVAARRMKGVSRWRLGLAGVGTLLLGGTILVSGLGALVPSWMPVVADAIVPLVALSAVTWYVGFLPPKRLRRHWQLGELYRMLQSLDDGGQPVADTLRKGITRALGAAEVRVLGPGAKPAGEGRWPASSCPEFHGRTGWVYHAPIAARGASFGHVLAWIPEGTLFPDADLALLNELARSAGRALAQQQALDAQTQLIERLQAANRQLLEQARHKDAFLANMSHELRTPMNAIIGFTEVLTDGKAGPVGPVQRELLGDVLTSSRHLLALIEDLLDLSRIEAGKLRLEYETVDLRDLAHTVAGSVSEPAAGVEVRVTVEPVVHRIVGDPVRLRQVLTNYLTNALKFTRQGHVEVAVTSAGFEHVRIAVSDTGIGIAPEDLSSLFRKFRQLDSGAAKRFQGTGLGLALTRQLVEGMGGTVGVDSQPGVGSTFWARLPRDPQHRTVA